MQNTETRLERLELLLWSMQRDAQVHGVVWAVETAQMLEDLRDSMREKTAA